MKQAIHTDKAPAAVGPYSQAVWAGDLLFLSGQIPLDPATGQMTGATVQDQTRRVLENIKNVLAEAGLTMAEVIKTTVFLADMADFPKVNAVYAEYFPEPFPARSCVAVAKLPKEALVEIEVVAGRG